MDKVQGHLKLLWPWATVANGTTTVVTRLTAADDTELIGG